MKSTISYLKILAGASSVLALAACDSIKDVPNKLTGALPADTVVLSGQINNLSSLRSITLQNNDDVINTKSFINAAPVTPNAGVRPVPFSFGALPVGSKYKIIVKTQPELKTCEVVNGEGTLTAGVRPDVVVNCVNNTSGTTQTRYDLTVSLPTDPTLFKGLQDARVRVTTEEEIREVSVNATSTTAFFPGVLISAPGALNAATYSVTASTFEGNTLNKCAVSRASASNPTANVSGGTAPAVGAVTGTAVDATLPACQFTVAGSIDYSQPAGTPYAPTAISGLKLQLRDLQMKVLEELTVGTCTPTAANANLTTTTTTTTLLAAVPVPFTLPAATDPCAYKFNTPVRSSSISGVYEVAVSQQPTGQSCIVVNAGSVSVFTTGTVIPSSITNANVFCRALPAADRQIQGAFRLQSSTWVPNVNAPVPVTSTWSPFDLTQWNTASSNMMAFFNNGTFLYGAHANSAQVEQGFYDYDPAAQKLRFTSIVDTNTSAVFPANFSPLPTIVAGSTFTQATNLTTTTPGLSATPNPIRQNGIFFPTTHAAMTGVTFGSANSGLGTVRTISGTFGGDAGTTNAVLNTTTPCSATAPCVNPTTGALITAGTCTPAAPCINATTGASITTGNTCTAAAPCVMPANTNRLSWVLQEPPQVDHEMTGAWLSQDARRFFVWDYRTYYGTSVGMLGGSPSMNDACFTIEDLHVSKGIYTRRGSATGCYPFSRPGNIPGTSTPGVFGVGNNGIYPPYFAGTGESTDFSLTPLTSLPGYTGRLPGGEPAPGTTSPSPIYFQVAPAASFFTTADATYFPPAGQSGAWCATEILGLRPTANGFPINYPVYYCRTRATP